MIKRNQNNLNRFTWWNFKSLFKPLRRRIEQDGEGSDEMKEEEDLDSHLDGSITDTVNDVTLNSVTQESPARGRDRS